jgi:hypothetical protein
MSNSLRPPALNEVHLEQVLGDPAAQPTTTAGQPA